MGKIKDNFSRRQLFAMCSVALLAPTLRLFPSLASELAGRGAWLSALLSAIPLLGYAAFLRAFMAKRGEGEGMAELVGRAPFGKALLVLFAGWFLLYGAMTLRSGAERFITTVFPNASAAVFSVSMGMIALIAALGACRTMTRTAKLVQPVVLGVLVLVLLAALSDIEAGNLFPVTIYNMKDVLKGTVPAVDVIVAIMYTACFLESSVPREPHRFRDTALWLGFAVLLLFFLAMDIVGAFGAELASRLTRPFFSLVRNLVFFRTVERIEALVVALWVFPDFVLTFMLLYAGQYCIRLAMGQDPRYIGEKLLDFSGARWVIWLCGGAMTAVAVILAPTGRALELWSERIIPLVNLAVAFGLLPLIFLLTKLRRKKP